MSETPLTPANIVGPYPLNPQSLTNQMLVTWTPGDPVNGNSFPYTGKEILLIKNANTGSTGRTYTISGQADSQNRKGDIGPITVAAGDVQIYDFTGGQVGWRDTNGNILLRCSHAELEFAVFLHK